MPDSSGGNEGAGPRRLAQAIVNDYLGFDVDLVVASAFLRGLVARLPPEFELSGERIASCVDDRPPRRMHRHVCN